MAKNKIYLSLDDLHKLYGISPETIRQIKRKRRKRRAKKQQQKASGVSGTGLKMGEPASTSNMSGSTAFNRTNDNFLEQAKIEKHLQLINTENERVAKVIDDKKHPLIEDAPPPRADPPPPPARRSIQDVFGELATHLETGRAKGTVNKASLNLSYDELRKPRGLGKKGRFEEVFDPPVPEPDIPVKNIIPFSDTKKAKKKKSKPPIEFIFDDEPYEYNNPLAYDMGSSNMNRDSSRTITFEDDADAYGIDGYNGGSDAFVANDYDVIPPPELDLGNGAAQQDQKQEPEQEYEQEQEQELEPPPPPQQPEQQLEPPAPIRRGRKPKPDSEKKFDDYSLTQIRNLATSKGIPYKDSDTRLMIFHKIHAWTPPG